MSNRIRHFIIPAIAAVSLVVSGTNSRAANFAVMEYDSGISATLRGSSGFTIGTRFQVNTTNIVINSLGFQFIDGSSYDVGLWQYIDELNGTLLASTTVSSTDALYDDYRYASLSSNIVLQAGQQYVVAGFLPSGTTFYDGNAEGQNLQPFSVNAGLTLTWAVYDADNGSALAYPSQYNTGPSFGRWGPANAAFIVPEPSTLGLGGLSVLIMTAAARSRRKKD